MLNGWEIALALILAYGLGLVIGIATDKRRL